MDVARSRTAACDCHVLKYCKNGNETVSVRSIGVPAGIGVLENADDVEVYVEALRGVLIQTLNDGKRISL